MATKMGYAPGTRIQIRDNSAYSVVENPNTVAGIVGYASKGELNKIIPVANTGELGTKLGYGYQSYKYNQGMYAANAVLMAGGEVEFVRPYGEEISRTDAYKRDLKTDCFVVTYDKNAGMYVDKKQPYAENSLNVKHFASTRFKTDGAAEFGVTRKINNISETVATGKNVEFNVDASENFIDSAASRKYDGTHCTDMVMFAIMNRDPSNAYRAYDRYEVSETRPYEGSNDKLVCTLSTKPVFVIGDTVFIPVTSAKEEKGTSRTTAKATVIDIEDKTVTLEFSGDDAKYAIQQNRPDVIIFSDSENAIADGFDYLNIKTAVAGSSVKNLACIKWGEDNKLPSAVVEFGSMIKFYDKSHDDYYVRLYGGKNPFSSVSASVDSETGNLVITVGSTAVANVLPGDKLILKLDDVVILATVKSIGTDSLTCSYDDTVTVPSSYTEATLKFDSFVDASESGYYVADVSGIADTEVNNDTWSYVAGKVAETIQANAGFSKVAVANDIKEDKDGNVLVSGKNITLDPSATYDYSIGDIVAIVRNSGNQVNSRDTANGEPCIGIYTITSLNTMSGVVTVDAKNDITLPTVETDEVIHYQLLNLTTTSATLYTATTKYADDVEHPVAVSAQVCVVTDGTSYTITNATLAEHATAGTVITLKKSSASDAPTETFTVTSVDNGILTGTISSVANATATHADTPVEGSTTYDFDGGATYTYTDAFGNEVVDMYMISSYTMYVSRADQKLPTFEPAVSYVSPMKQAGSTGVSQFFNEVEKSDIVLADSDIGASFMALGLAKTKFIDINYDGNPLQVYILTDEGIEIARMFMAVRYRFNGTLYEFEGTVAPYNLNGRQLSIVEAAEYELEDSGLEFVINDSGVLEYFLENNSYDLSQTLQNGVLNGSMTAIAYNEDDPAIKNDAVWSYDPNNNNSGSTLSTVWNLFVNKDASDVDMLVAAGIAVNSPFTRKYETLNTQVMQAMLNVCEARKDCFAIFDGLNEPDINKAQKKLIVADGFGSTYGRWGFLYDGRGVFQDSIYTNSQVDVMKSVQLASIITANRQGGVFWIPAAGDEAYIPSAWGTKEKFVRSYNPEDKNCDHAKLSDIHVNATRVNKDGMRIFGDFTLQMEDTAFNQMHVTMLVAGLHKMFYKYLDHKVFKLNTTILRAQITSDLQDKLNAIIRQNPPGLINGKVICDDTNNTPEIIDQNYLIVDLKILPPKSTRWIILRTTVESTKNGKNISTTIVSE